MDPEESNVDQPIYDLEALPVELARAKALRAPVPKPPRRSDYGENAEGHLAVDVYETPGEIVVESAIAGVNPEELDVVATNNSLSIKGERRRVSEVRRDNYLHEECWWGRFSRTVLLPQEVNPEEAAVTFRNGILTVRLLKADWKSPKKLRIVR